MAGEATTKRRREANAEDFRRLLARFDSDPVQAWQAYDSLRRKLVMFFEHHRDLDAEELAADAMERIAKKTDAVEIGNIAEFAFGVARNVRREALRRLAATPRISDLALGGDVPSGGADSQNPAEDMVIERIDQQRKFHCLVQCMKRIDSDDRRMLFLYYPQQNDELEERRQQLAESLSLTLGTLRTRIARLREKLERCFQDCREHSMKL
jgi:RNA polymerase sigma factor (sigma-70 family)